jgi:hypothetical protein
MQKIIKNYGLTQFCCSNCNKPITVIPDEFLDKINPPCKKCQGWEINYNFGIYLSRIDSNRYTKYMEMQAKLS